MINAVMHGCNGAMGRTITSIIKEDSDIKLIAGIDINDTVKQEYPVYKSLDELPEKPDVIIDFASYKAMDGLLNYCEKTGTPAVLCTTGLSGEQTDRIKELGKKVPLLKSANMSLGINTIMKLLKQAVSVLAPAGFDIEVVEKHHNLKKDAPSGTALALADSMNEEMGNVYEYVYDRSKRDEKRKEKELGISSVRGGNIVGEHEVFFCGLDEVIEIKHTAYSKAVFAKGAVSAAKFLAGKPAGLYDMQDVIGG